MIDWTQSMEQTYQYCLVDKDTWLDASIITDVTTHNITRDISTDTLHTASIERTSENEEQYIRIYLLATQSGVTYREALGTFLFQPSESKYDGKMNTIPYDGYSPLIELSNDYPPIGYTVLKGANTILTVEQILRDKSLINAPVICSECDHTLLSDYVANTDDTWLTFLSGLISMANYEFTLDGFGRVTIAPIQSTIKLRPLYTFNVDEKSILYPDFSNKHDMYALPNVLEVVYSDDSHTYICEVINDDENSPISVSSRGRKVKSRDVSPSFTGTPTIHDVEQYTKEALKASSTLEYTLTFEHGYYPVTIGDCVSINVPSYGLDNTKVRITSQSIESNVGCSIKETVTYSKQLFDSYTLNSTIKSNGEIQNGN